METGIAMTMMNTMTKCCLNSGGGDVYDHAYGHTYGHDGDYYEMHGDDGDDDDCAENDVVNEMSRMNRLNRATCFDENDCVTFSQSQRYVANVPLKFLHYMSG